MKKSMGSLRFLIPGAVLCAIQMQLPVGAAEALAPQALSMEPAAIVAQPDGVVTADSIHDVRAAVRIISQAALQRDFASNAQIRALLQSAHDLLATSEPSLCCDARVRLVQLERDIERMVGRVDNVSDAWQDRDGVTIRPPDRDELNLLAKEGQDLLRNPVAQSGKLHDDSFSIARNAARLPANFGRPDVAGRPHRAWPASASSPAASTLLSLNF